MTAAVVRFPARHAAVVWLQQASEGAWLVLEVVAPPGYRIEVLVEMRAQFTNGDSLRLRWPQLVPIEEGMQ
jgi:hypothetical protein